MEYKQSFDIYGGNNSAKKTKTKKTKTSKKQGSAPSSAKSPLDDILKNSSEEHQTDEYLELSNKVAEYFVPENSSPAVQEVSRVVVGSFIYSVIKDYVK